MGENKKILFISDRVYPTLTANTINTKNVIDILREKGHEITYIAIDQNENVPEDLFEDILIYKIKSTIYGKFLRRIKENRSSTLDNIIFVILRIIRKLNNLIFLMKFPDVDPFQSEQIYRLSNKLHAKNDYDCVIAVFRPFSGVSATMKMKKKYPDLICGAYFLDLINGASKPSCVPTKIYERLIKLGEKKAYNSLDFILLPKNSEQKIKKEFKEIQDKLYFSDFPVFKIIRVETKSKNKKKDQIVIVYAGALDEVYRNPECFLKIFHDLSRKNNNIEIHLYGRNNCESIIKKYSNSFLNITNHGMVPHNEVLKIQLEADFLVNIGNKMDDMVPSKIFELFSTGKPIINFISSKNDVTENYFNRYPAVCNIKETENFNKNASNVLNFINNYIGVKYDFEEIEHLFPENNPEYTARLIEDIIRKLN